MVTKTLFIATFIITASVTDAASVPFITKCKSDDAGCITSNAVRALPIIVAGIPELGLISMDPAFYKSVDCSTPDLKLVISNFTISGLKGSKVLDIHRDKSKSKLYMKLLCSLKGEGLYEMSGKVLNIDMNGQGPFSADIKSFVLNFESDFEEVEGPDSKKHFNIKNYKHGFEFKEKSVVEFKNLHASDETLTASVIELIKENGNEIVTQLGAPVFAAAYANLNKNLNKFFSSVPVEELSID